MLNIMEDLIGLHGPIRYLPPNLAKFLHNLPRPFGDSDFTIIDGYGKR